MRASAAKRSGAPSGWRKSANCARRSRRKAQKPSIPRSLISDRFCSGANGGRQANPRVRDAPGALPRRPRWEREPSNKRVVRPATRPSTCAEASRRRLDRSWSAALVDPPAGSTIASHEPRPHPAPKDAQGKSVAPRLMRYNYARNRPASAPERAFSRSINAASPGPFGSTTFRECFFTSGCGTANT